MGEDKSLLEPGGLLDNRYEVVRKLAEGGMASIYLVRHLGLHSLHALKVPDPRIFHSADARHRFTTEGRIQALLRHPHIAQVTDIVISPVPGLVMEYVEGGTLEELLGQSPGGRLGLPVLRQLFLPVLDAMQEAHGHRVVHRDLTPSNILLTQGHQGRMHPKVTDFGIAKVTQDEPGEKYRTRTGVLLGTRPYMSPEQIGGTSEVDARTDIFALGAILYEAATGRVAFDAGSDFEMMKRITEGHFTPPEQVVPELPERLCQCIRKAMTVDPAGRFQDCAAFRAALEQALEEPVAPVPVPAPVPVAVPTSRGRGLRVGLGVLGGLSVLLLVGLVSTLGDLHASRKDNERLQASHQTEQQDTRRLQQELDIARTQARSSAAEARDLHARNQGTLQQLQENEQLKNELQQFQHQALKFLEMTLLDTAVHNNLQAFRVLRTCNKTGTVLSYQYLDDERNWSEPLVLEPGNCISRWMTGYLAQVPVRVTSLKDGVTVEDNALAGMVVGRMPDTEADWRPWENQLVPGQDNGIQLKPVYRETRPLRGASQAE
ncbi:protein kinase [Archangium gephyra]|uniref:serine/threonine protein kinase n=1 Tax=Archangium gephyra TaxID=48 RepID=UPI0035D5127C